MSAEHTLQGVKSLRRRIQILSPLPPNFPPTTFPVSRVPFPERTGAAYQDVPLTQIRKTIAKRLATSLGPIPHFFLTTEVDMERASEARDEIGRAHV